MIASDRIKEEIYIDAFFIFYLLGQPKICSFFFFFFSFFFVDTELQAFW